MVLICDLTSVTEGILFSWFGLQSWVAASTEAFYTWGLLGAAAMQVASHNRPKHFLHRDTAIVIIFTLSILALSAFLANSCTQILLAHGFVYMPSSFGKF